MSPRSGPSPRRALEPSQRWYEWLLAEDPDDWDEECGDRNGEESEEDYDLGCVILAALVGLGAGATIMLLVIVSVG